MQFFIVTFRETLEAAIIVGLIYSIIQALGGGRKSLGYLFGGVIGGILFSIGLFFILQYFSLEFESTGGKIYEGTMMLIAGLLVTHLIFWAHKRSKHLKEKMEKQISNSLVKNELVIISTIAFLSVAREGIETVLFLSALDFTSGSMNLIYALSGILVALITSLCIIKIWKNIKLHSIFKVTNIFLIIIAGGLLGHAVSVFEGAQFIPTVMKPLFDIRGFLSEESGIGGILKAAFSYDGNPSLSAFLVQFGYIGTMLYIVLFRKRK